MVNEKRDIKKRILKLLADAKGDIISGVTLSRQLGVSRVAVWKHLTALKESGVDIISASRGYRLSDPDDLLMPFCFAPRFHDRIFHFQDVTSTMDSARELAQSGAPHLSLVLAEDQTGGRGRLNRKWTSSRGGLWMTLILKPHTPPPLTYQYNFIASTSLCKVLRRLFDLDVRVKWPNDLLLHSKKICGLLSEMETRGDMVEFINIGMGLNVNNHPAVDEPNAVSLSDVMGRHLSRRLIVESFLDDFSTRIQTLEPVRVIKEWKALSATIGTRVRIETPGRIHTGLAVDVDASGALIIEEDPPVLNSPGNGQVPAETGVPKQSKIIYGDCFHTEKDVKG